MVRAISRRIGSKHEMTTASGVSSMMTSTPVSVSSVRMLRPSRPMIRPFISSFGRLTVVTVTSEATSAARRWMEVTRMSRAFLSAESFASCSMRLTETCASCRASFSRLWISCFLASARVSPEIRSSSAATCWPSCSSSVSLSWAALSRVPIDLSCFSRVSTRLSRFSSFCNSLRSVR